MPRDVRRAAHAPSNETAEQILEAATAEFALKGFDGARVDAIADRTNTSKRMLYYYYESKDALYAAVLERGYRRLRTTELDLNLRRLAPLDALAGLVGFAFDYHVENPDFVRIVMTENIQRGEHARQMPRSEAISGSVIGLIDEICQRGVAEGVMRPPIDAVDLHKTISGLCFFNVSNMYTFAALYGAGAPAPADPARRQSIIRTVLRTVSDDVA